MDIDDLSEEEQEEYKRLQQRYKTFMHGVQTGVKMCIQRDGLSEAGASPKHLRAGVNSALIDSAAVIELLMEKGIIDPLELMEKLCEKAEEEVRRYEDRISGDTDTDVTLL